MSPRGTSSGKQSGIPERGTPRILRPELWLVSAAFVFFFAVLLRPVLTGSIIPHEDIGRYFFPLRWWYGQRLQNGESFLWNPSLFGGFYIYGEGQHGMFHPLHLLLYRFLPAYAAFGLSMALAYAGLALGHYKLFREWKVSSLGAAIGAFLGSFGGFLSMRFGHPPALQVWAHTPWNLFMMHRLFLAETARERRLYFAATALLTASQCYMGHPPFLFFSLLLEGWYLLYLVMRPGWSLHLPWKTPLALFLGAKALGFVAGLGQLLPTWDVVQHSSRTAPDYEFLSGGSLHPAELLQWLNPAMLRSTEVSKIETLTFWGTGTLLLAAWGLLRGFGEKRLERFSKYLLVLFAVSLFFALGKYNGAFAYYYSYPPFSLFREPTRFMLLTHFALTGLAVVAVDSFMTAEAPRALRIRFLAVGALLFTGALATIVLRGAMPPIWHDALLAMFPKFYLALSGGAMVAGTALVFCWAAAVSRNAVAKRIAICVLLLELMLFFGRIYWRFPMISARDLSAVGSLPPVDPPGPVADSLISDHLIVAGYRLAGGYAAMEPIRESQLGVHSEAFERLMGVQAVKREFAGSWASVLAPVVPRIRLISRIQVHSASAEDLLTIDPATEAVVDRALSLAPDSKGTVIVTSDQPGRIELESDTTGAMLGVLTERYHEYWRVFVAGREEAPVRTDGDLLGFVTPSGKQKIVLRFIPPHLNAFLWLGLGIATLLAVIAAFSLSKRATRP